MSAKRRYVIVAGGTEYALSPADVLPWLRGYLAHMGTQEAAAELSAMVASQLEQRVGETPSHVRYRVLRTCHDQRIVVYVGIRQE